MISLLIHEEGKMFISEKDLRDKFWKFYNGKGRAIKYQFECELRDGGVDLITLERYQENFQINAFEFKLNDLKKVIRQAEENVKLVNKSWIVIPEERKETVNNKYYNACREKGIGIIYVHDGGKWELGLLPRFNNSIVLSQKLLNFLMKGYC